MVHPHGHAAGRVQCRPRAAALRRGRSDRDRVVQRCGAGHAHGRLPTVHGGHHRGAGQGKHDPRVRARRDQQVPAPARQADAAPARHLVHAAERHLADGLARERAAELHPLPARDAAVRRASGGDHRRGRGAVHDRPGGKALHVPGGCAGARAGAVIPPLVAGAADALPLQRDARQRHGLQLLCHAQMQRRDGQGRHAPPVSQRQAVFSQRAARSGLLAGRALHRAERRRARLRHPAGQGHGLQYAAQAHQGRVRPLVLPL